MTTPLNKALRPGYFACILGHDLRDDDRAHRFLTDRHVPFSNLPLSDGIDPPTFRPIPGALGDLDIVLLVDHGYIPDTVEARQTVNREFEAFLHFLDLSGMAEGSIWEILSPEAFNLHTDRDVIEDVSYVGSVVLRETKQVIVKRTGRVDYYVFLNDASGKRTLENCTYT